MEFKLDTMQQTRLRDVLFNMHQSSGATDEYRKGIIVGVVAGIMATNPRITWKQAIEQVAFHMPDAGTRISIATVPETWFAEIATCMGKYGKRWINPV